MPVLYNSACSWLKNPAAHPSASAGQKEVLLSSLVPLAWLQLARGMNGFKTAGFLVEFGVFLRWYTIELLMTAKENDSLIENSSSFTGGSGMVKLTLRKLSIIKHSYCKFLIENLYSKSLVNLTPNKAFANFIFSQTVQLWMSHTHVFSYYLPIEEEPQKQLVLKPECINKME